MKRHVLIVLLTGILIVIGTCAWAKPKLKVGCDTNFMPFEFKKDGKYVGFDIDLWEAVAGELNVDYQLTAMDFNGLIPGLQSGAIDVAIAGMTIKSEREKVVDFSYPYYDAGLTILVRDDSRIRDIEDLSGKVVATKLGTTSADFARQHCRARDLKLFPNIDGAYMELIMGGADAVVFDSPALAYYAATAGKGKVKVVGPRYMGQSYGMAFPQGSSWREGATIAILKLMENGEYSRIYKKWFGTEPR